MFFLNTLTIATVPPRSVQKSISFRKSSTNNDIFGETKFFDAFLSRMCKAIQFYAMHKCWRNKWQQINNVRHPEKLLSVGQNCIFIIDDLGLCEVCTQACVAISNQSSTTIFFFRSRGGSEGLGLVRLLETLPK
jgi:hypothetical protein